MLKILPFAQNTKVLYGKVKRIQGKSSMTRTSSSQWELPWPGFFRQHTSLQAACSSDPSKHCIASPGHLVTYCPSVKPMNLFLLISKNCSMSFCLWGQCRRQPREGKKSTPFSTWRTGVAGGGGKTLVEKGTSKIGVLIATFMSLE